VPTSDAQGGGTSYPDTSLALTNVVFAANTSYSSGGGAGMNAAGGTATLTNVDFVTNGGSGGSGLRLGSSDSQGPNNATVTVTNSVFWGNAMAGTPTQIVATGGTLTVADSDVQGGWTGVGNIDSFPFINSGDPGLLTDVDWDGLDNVFGTVDDGIRLGLGSPAVDTGDGAALAGDVTTDLFGASRYQDGDGDGASTVDMGALEARPRVSNGVIYVNGAATGANDGTSWANAFTDLQAGLDLAAPGAGTQVWVAAGAYRPTIGTDRIATFLLKSGVTVYGGFAAAGDPGFADRDPDTFVTTLSGDLKGDDAVDFANRGDNVSHVVSAFSWVDGTAVLDGVTIRGGNANGSPRMESDFGGGGMYNKNGAPRLVGVTLSDNRASGRGGGMYTIAGAPDLTGVTFAGNYGANAGGGLQVDSGSMALTDVTFEGNSSYGVGGGMCVTNPDEVLAVPDVTLTGATFTGNIAQYGGGYAASAGNVSMHGATFTANHVGYYNTLNEYVGDMDLLDVVFRGNSASNTPSTGSEVGGAMVIGDAAPTLTNVVFSGNDADGQGGAIYLMTYYIAGGPTFTNVTFSGNAAASGGAISAEYGRGTIKNSILWGDIGGEIAGGTFAVDHSLVQGGFAGAGNINADPLFVSPVDPGGAGSAGDLRLQATSPALDAGLTASLPAGVATDLDGSPRVMGPAVDMGAYEYHVPVTISPPTAEVVSTIDGPFATFHATVSPAAALTGLDFTLHLEFRIIKRRGGWHEIKPVAMSEGPSGALSASCSLPKRGYWRAWVESSAPSGYYVPGTSSALTFVAM
jgi:predicted outer membrane repeat protein